MYSKPIKELKVLTHNGITNGLIKVLEEKYGDSIYGHSFKDYLFMVFEDYIEEYYIGLYEELDFKMKNNCFESFNSKDKISNQRFRIKRSLSKQELSKLSILQSKLLHSFDSFDVVDVNPYKSISNEIKANYKYKITKSLIEFYNSYQTIKIIFGNTYLQYEILESSNMKDYQKYLFMIKKYKEMKNEKWIKPLLENYPEIEYFYDVEV